MIEMTCLEKLKKDHPDWNEHELEGARVDECPSDFGYLEDDDYPCEELGCEICWNREIPEEPVTPTEEKTVNEQRAEQGLGSVKEGSYVETHILDSGDRTEFSSGAVRDMRTGKGRCDLMPLEVASHMLEVDGKDDQVLALIRIFQKTGSTEALYIALDEFRTSAYGNSKTMLLEVAKHYEEGALKYGPDNWQKGIPVWCYIDSAVRHYLKWLRGDKDEPHDRAFVWNLMCCIWEVDYHTKTIADKGQDNV